MGWPTISSIFCPLGRPEPASGPPPSAAAIRITDAAMAGTSRNSAKISGGAAPTPYGHEVDVDARLRELGLELPTPMTPAGNYVPAATVGDLVYLSGAGPLRPDGTMVVGKVGDGGLDLDAAREAARLTGLQLLAALRAEIGDLGRVRRVARIFGMVNCAPGFNRTPAVIDGCSDLLVEVLGDAGRGARSAVGMAELPFDIAVEIEAVVQVST
jgi:enamine deaminase RidA (YjgF/YER057c/UK114 family)